jgi:hypothetical protein
VLEKLKADGRKVELEVKSIRYFRAGYVLILLTPLLSFYSLYWITGIAFAQWLPQDYLLLPVWNVSIVALCITGIALYIYGYERREARVTEAKLILLLSLFLIPWGVLTYLFASGLLNAEIVRSMNPGMGALTVWDYMEIWTWELKAVLWIGTGLLLAVTSLMKMHSH